MFKGFIIIIILFTFNTLAPVALAEQNAREIKNEIKTREQNKQKLEQQAADLREQQNRLRANLIKLAKQIKNTDATRDRLETRLRELNKGEQVLKTRLKKNRAQMAQTLAGLQMLETNPPPPFLVGPDDAQAAVRGAVLLAAIIPKTRSDAARLRAQLSELAAVQAAINSERKKLGIAEQQHAKQRGELNTALNKKSKAEAAARAAARAEHKEIAALVKQARNLRDLSFRLEQRAKNSRAKNSRAKNSRAQKQNATSRFASERGKISLPVAGKIAGKFGAPDAQGSPRQGLAIAARSGAQVIAPYDAQVLYAGAFRQYGNIVILKIDGAYQLVLSGLAATQNYVGQAILAGEPVGILPENNTRQTLYVELRYKGEPIDPAPFFN